MVIAPFPFAQLDAVTKSEARAGRSLRAHLAHAVDLDHLERAFAELSPGVPVRVRVLPRRVRKFSTVRGADDFVGVAFSHGESTAIGDALLLEVSGALAAALTRRALKRPDLRVYDAGKSAPPELVGSFVALALAVARRAFSEATLRVVSAGPGALLSADLLRAAGGDAYTLSFAVLLDGSELGERREGEAFEARVSIARARVASPPTEIWNHATLASLGVTPLALRIVFCSVIARARDIAELAPGDAFMLGEARVALSADGAPEGNVMLIAPRGEHALSARIANAGSLVFEGALSNASWSETEKMEDTGKTELALADAPVVVRVEIGACEMPAREWASLKNGDVVSLRKRLGEHVTLRVSGVEVAPRRARSSGRRSRRPNRGTEPNVTNRLVSGFIVFASCTHMAACNSSSSGGSAGAGNGQPAGSASAGTMIGMVGADASGADKPGTTSPAASGSASANANGANGAGGTFSGSYTSEQAKDPPPKKAEDDGGDGIGDGTLTLSIAPDNSAKGTLAGPLGECVLYGTVVGDTVTGTVFPKASSSGSFYGTFVATKKDGAWSGKIVASRGNAGAVRDASFTLKAS